RPQEQVRRRIERLAFQARRTIRSAAPESVHDLLVAIRRAEQALVTLKVYFPRKPAKKIRKQLKVVLAAAGAVRDFDIAIEILARTDQPGAAELRRDIRTRRKTAGKSLLAALKRLSLRTRLSRWCDELNLSAPQDG